ncbi:MAG: winged helix-turn-helix transcriptional regulator [Actinomycetota bacterium]|nr:winged helix-turn-helix transcriptional regulator [Actinomycetota bacterium]
MRKDEIFLKEAEALQSLRALEEIEKNPEISQRELSSHLGVALGITNALLKTLARKGLVKIRGNNNRSLTYHLTHAGVLAKSKLAMEWTLNTIDFYRQARLSIAGKMAALSEQGIDSVVLFGNSEVTEIAAIVAPEVGIRIIGIIDGQIAAISGTILGYPVMRFEQLTNEQPDAIIICLEADDARIEALSHHVEATTRLCRLT